MQVKAMDHYCDIQLRPDPDFVPAVLMNALCSKLHRALVAQPSLQLGISFPDYSLTPRTLGNCLRLHGLHTELTALHQSHWLSGMQDHVLLGAIQAVPTDAQQIAVRRVQAKSSPERLAKRYAQRHNISESEALVLYQSVKPKKLKLPFLTLNSQSTGQRFTLFIQQSKPQSQSVAGTFNRYGLSTSATVPWF